jgi:hypothetical protein
MVTIAMGAAYAARYVAMYVHTYVATAGATTTLQYAPVIPTQDGQKVSVFCCDRVKVC